KQITVLEVIGSPSKEGLAVDPGIVLVHVVVEGQGIGKVEVPGGLVVDSRNITSRGRKIIGRFVPKGGSRHQGQVVVLIVGIRISKDIVPDLIVIIVLSPVY